MRKADIIFNHAINNDRYLKELTEIVIDERWQRSQFKQFNHELAHHAYLWAKSAYSFALSNCVIEYADAKTILAVANKVLTWRNR